MILAGRFFYTHTWLQALAISLVAVTLSGFIWSLAPATYTAMEWGWYDTWLTLRQPPETNAQLLLILRDQRSDQQFGSGIWDRAVIARLLTALDDAGAAAIGIDVPLRVPSPPTLGGAVSDALLLEAVRSASHVVHPETATLPVGDPTLAPSPQADGSYAAAAHLQPALDNDRIVRRVPLSLETRAGAIPAFGFKLATTFWNRPEDQGLKRSSGATTRNVPASEIGFESDELPVDQEGRLLVSFVGGGTADAFHSITFADLWQLTDNRTNDRLQSLVKGKAVLMLSNPSAARYASPLGTDLSAGMIQAHLLDTLLSRRWTYELSPVPKLIVGMTVCFLAAWFLFAIKGGKGSFLTAGVISAYIALVLVALPGIGWLLPLTIPLTACALVSLSATVLEHRLSARKITLLERDMLRIQEEMVAVREALVCRENAVDALEEDLESTRLSASSSAGRQQELIRTTDALRTQIDEAQVQEEAARRRIDELLQELTAIRTVGAMNIPLGDSEQERLRQDCEQFSIITAHPALLAEFRDLKKAARTSLTILITGEPGTGKELFARAVHRLSSRAGRSFIAVNMAAISPELFESELFGHLRGSFTGAVSDRKGYFELAHQGTIFLDEIGDLRLDHQSKLLRVLQEQTFYRVGATSPTTVDVRIVAATNKDLQRGVSEGWFREDLYFRLKGFVLRLPPLRERREDIIHIANHLIQQTARRQNGDVVSLSDDAWLALQQHDWKGNVRELQHCLERADALSEGRTMTKDDLRLSADGMAASDLSSADRLMPEPAGDAAVLDILRQQGFDMQATAKTLGWDRTTVTQRLKGLCFQALVANQGDRAKAATALAGNPALVRTVELKIMDYHGHLQKTIQQFSTVEEAILDCKRRFKNLPERHFKSVEALVRDDFRHKSDASLSLAKDSQPTR